MILFMEKSFFFFLFLCEREWCGTIVFCGGMRHHISLFWQSESTLAEDIKKKKDVDNGTRPHLRGHIFLFWQLESTRAKAHNEKKDVAHHVRKTILMPFGKTSHSEEIFVLNIFISD